MAQTTERVAPVVEPPEEPPAPVQRPAPAGPAPRKLKFPTAFTVLAAVLLLVWVASFIVPAGAYKIDPKTDGPVPGTYRELPACSSVDGDALCVETAFNQRLKQLWIAPSNGLYADDPAPAGRRLRGSEAVIDKDLASALPAIEIGADALAIVTDVDAVYADWGRPEQRAIRSATPEALSAAEFAAGSMGPKVRAACWFAQRTGNFAAIGSITETQALLRGEAGTRVAVETAVATG